MRICAGQKVIEYEVHIAKGALARVGQLFDLERRVLVVTDAGVPAQYATIVAGQCQSPVQVCLPRGEAGKSPACWQQLLQTMLEHNFDRHDCVVAVGGGVVGDVSGFAAACYMRGIDFYNVPTTLLAQADASVGGKTAINFGGVKNSVGAFYVPRGVLLDPAVLATLDGRQLASGVAEIIKIGATCDVELVAHLEQCADLQKELGDLLFRAVQLKQQVVEQDFRETGLRKVLNFGHTVGHAIEAAAGGRLLHGECVGLGMLCMCSAEVAVRLRNMLQKYQLPVVLPAGDFSRLPELLLHDKKARQGVVETVWVEKTGSFEFRQQSVPNILAKVERIR